MFGGSNHTRTANTNISKYHVGHAKYLQSKCKTYVNLMLGEKISNNTYNPISCNSAFMDAKTNYI